MDPAVKDQFYGCNSFLFACFAQKPENMKGNSEIVKYLYIEFPDLVNSVDKDNNNALHLASTSGNLEVSDGMLVTRVCVKNCVILVNSAIFHCVKTCVVC